MIGLRLTVLAFAFEHLFVMLHERNLRLHANRMSGIQFILSVLVLSSTV